MRTMARDTDFDFEKTTKTIRFNDDERERLREIMRRVRGRSRSAAQMADPSKLIKELMGLADFGLVTDDDRRYIAGDVTQQPGCAFCGKPAKNGLCVACRGDLTGSPRLTQAKLEDLPYGGMVLNEEGTILAYNKAETEMSRISHKKAVGKNFFTLAPCADIQDFHGRYDTFLRGSDSVREFSFIYKFPHGAMKVSITFTRLDSQRVLVTARKQEKSAERKTG